MTNQVQASITPSSLLSSGHSANSLLTEYKDLLSVQDLTAIFNVSKQTIYKEMKAGKFGTPIRIGRAYKIPRIRILQQYFQND